MINLDWDLVVSILTALGIFEVIKKILLFSIENNLLKKNLEIRKMANRAFEYNHWLKLRNFEQPLDFEATSQLILDINKIDAFDKELADDLMALVNKPRMMDVLYKNGDEKHRVLITEFHNELYAASERVKKKLNHLRYKPLFSFKA